MDDAKPVLVPAGVQAAAPPGRVAVVAVHGVADQREGDSSAALAGLLMNLTRQGERAYGSFRKVALRLRTDALRAEATEARGKAPAGHNPFDERSRFVQQAMQSADAQASTESPDRAFTRELLHGYRNPDPAEHYATERFEGTRSASFDSAAIDLHVYELYWADLSRLGNNVLQILFELYQLAFHLPSLGRTALDMARVEHPKNRWLRWCGHLHTWAVRLLTTFVPALNLLFIPFALGLLALVFLDSEAAQYWTSGVALAAVTLGGTILALFRSSPWAGAAVLAHLGCALFLLVRDANALRFLLFEAALLGFALSWVVVTRYDLRRPGAKAAMISALIFTLGALPLGLVTRSTSPVQIALHMIEWIYFGLNLVWVPLLLLQSGAVFAGFVACAGMAGDHERRRLRSATLTARLTLSISILMFLTVTLSLVAGLEKILFHQLPAEAYTPVLLTHVDGNTVPEFVHQLIVMSGTRAFPYVFACGFLAVVIGALAMLPSVVAELSPARSVQDQVRYGRWLDGAIGWLRWAGELLPLATAVLMPFGVVATGLRWELWPEGAPDPFAVAGTVVAGTAAGWLAFRGRLESLSLGFRPVLDVALNVDNYLRRHPIDDNPRARIFTRYASLLRQLAAPADGRRYDAIVIVAHSQGTVITADLLRYLQCHPDDAIERAGGLPKLFLFTMGSPLRQLYGARFPHLYAWTTPLPATAGALAPNAIADDAQPRPDELRVAKWVNAYRSGDYVGRDLWGTGFARPEAPPPPPASTWSIALGPERCAEDAARTRREFCIGPGAHTHYWDDTGELIAAELDRLIVEASSASLQGAPDGESAVVAAE